MIFSNKVYDILKIVATIILPALVTLWLTIGKIWNIPLTVEIGATVTAIAVFLGACLKVSTNNYNKKLEDGAGETDEE